MLDVGCGNGVVSELLQRSFDLNLIGADVIQYLKEDIPFQLLENLEGLPFADKSFETVLLIDVLHHVDDCEPLLKESIRVGRQVVIFEDEESLLVKVIDVILNRLYDKRMNCPLKFKKPEEWEGLFVKLGVSFERGRVKSPFWYPLVHYLYRLSSLSCLRPL